MRTLELRHNALEDDGARVFAQTEGLDRLETLDLTYNRLSDDGARALARSPHLHLRARRTWARFQASAESPFYRRVAPHEDP